MFLRVFVLSVGFFCYTQAFLGGDDGKPRSKCGDEVIATLPSTRCAAAASKAREEDSLPQAMAGDDQLRRTDSVLSFGSDDEEFLARENDVEPQRFQEEALEFDRIECCHPNVVRTFESMLKAQREEKLNQLSYARLAILSEYLDKAGFALNISHARKALIFVKGSSNAIFEATFFDDTLWLWIAPTQYLYNQGFAVVAKTAQIVFAAGSQAAQATASFTVENAPVVANEALKFSRDGLTLVAGGIAIIAKGCETVRKTYVGAID